jgi:hypothetical protein
MRRFRAELCVSSSAICCAKKKYDVQVSDSPSTETRIEPALTFLAQKEDQVMPCAREGIQELAL